MKKIVLYIFLFLLSSQGIKASHIVGGDFSLQHQGGDQYLLTLKVFRDCQNGVPPFNEPLYVGMFEKGTNIMVKSYRFNNIKSNDTLIFVGDNCINIPDGCTHIGLYQQVINLSPSEFNSARGYYFSWERCCRNVIIKNIEIGDDPQGEVGMAFYMEIPPLSIQNSTPVFNRDPLTLLCVGNPFTFNYNVTDADGDSLVYSLVEPLKGTLTQMNPNDPNSPDYPIINPGPYHKADWRKGYHLGFIIDGDPTLSIHPRTGELNITPTRQGVYVVSILVEEYRNGVKIGEVRRELQFTISTCNQNTAPEISENIQNEVYTIAATDKLCLPISATDADPNDSLFLTFEGDVFPGGSISAPFATMSNARGFRSVSTEFCWQTVCAHASEVDTYEIVVRVTDNGCPIAKTSVARFQIVVLPPPTIDPPAMVCFDREGPDALTVRWGRFDSTDHFREFVLVKEFPDGTTESFTFTNPANTSYYDNEAFDNKTVDYCYYMYGINICGKVGDTSYRLCTSINRDSVPDPTHVVTATVTEEEAVKVIWEEAVEPDFYGYKLFRKENSPDSQYEQIAFITNRDQLSHEDRSVNVHTSSYCYSVTVLDQCGYESDTSNRGCNVVLSGTSFPFEHSLQWTSYDQWDHGVKKYELMRRDPVIPYSVISSGSESAFSYLDQNLNEDEGAYWYKIVAHEEDGNSSRNATSESNEVFLFQPPLLYVPNAFTPNDDDINDDWGIKPVFVKSYEIKVYNRWGQLVYESQNKRAQWKGDYRRTAAFHGVYVYLITYTGWDDSIHYRKGTVTVYD
ncbi:MAG: gliding motility-associated C-terminal domain-containing protein [Bacteroidia bacterium]